MVIIYDRNFSTVSDKMTNREGKSEATSGRKQPSILMLFD